MSIDVASFHQAFFEEASDLLDGFEGHLLKLEESPDDVERLNSIFRCAHSIKGGAATFGFPELTRFTHSLETLLDCVRNHQVFISKPLCALLLESLDQMRALLSVAKGELSQAPDSVELIMRIDAAIACGESNESDSEDEGWGFFQEPQIYELSFRPGADCLQQGIDPLRVLEELAKIAEILSIECDLSSLPSLQDLEPETSYLGWNSMIHTAADPQRIVDLFAEVVESGEFKLYRLGGEAEGEEVNEAFIAVDSTSATTPIAILATPKDGGTIKVSSDKLDKLINLVGELVISQSMLNSVTEDFTMAKISQLLETVALMERSSRELQERVMGMRLLPIKMAFGRFPRLVHDLSSSIGKKIELRLVGEETELDKNLIEAIGDPLTHLVRNSVDHGLESPEDRIAEGKPPTGLLTIGAYQEGGNIVIEVADDGRGLAAEKIRSKAIKQGLIAADDSLSDEQTYNLIFHPGFSTAEKITDLSGRGVGMDIVKQAIGAIGGTVMVFSTPGKGMSTRIRLPLTMAILEGQSMSVGGGVYIVPLTSILESIRPRQEDVHNVAHLGEVVSVRGEYLQVMRLYEVYGAQPLVTNLWEGSLVLVECDGRKVALFADELMGQGQVVLKSLETNYRKVEGIAGATILGDGRVALIVDVPGLIRGMKDERTAYRAA